MRIIDAKGMVLGRLGAYVAKKALLGETIRIVNCESAVISGDRAHVFAAYKRRADRGIHTKGPFQPRRPDLFVKKAVRGMLPYKQPKGTAAFKRIRCYLGVPRDLIGKGAEQVPGASGTKVLHSALITVGEICTQLGWKPSRR
ncbi:50S ribosomal protein L13 [Candidatus Woesearchaeota archaeon]|nr:50S ribosomal protein L13 [Candidatus Woesearchaeota archaeon]